MQPAGVRWTNIYPQPYHSTNSERQASSGFYPLYVAKYGQFCWRAEERAKQLLPPHSLILLDSLTQAMCIPCACLLNTRSSPGTSSLTFWEQSHAGASQVRLLTRTTFYLNASCLQGLCSWSCKGKILRIRNKSSLATCEFSSAGCGREGEQERAYFKPELKDFSNFFEERKDTFCSLP